MSRSTQSVTPGTTSSTQNLATSPLSPRETFMKEFLLLKKSEMGFRNYPDWTLVYRVEVAHPNLLSVFREIREKIESSLKDDQGGSKQMLGEYHKKLDEYLSVFELERLNLDKIRNVQHEAKRFDAQLKAYSEKVKIAIADAGLDKDKQRVMKKILLIVKIHIKEMKQCRTELFSISLQPEDAFSVRERITLLEKFNDRLAEAVASREMNFLHKAIVEHRSKQITVSKKNKLAAIDNSEPLKALLESVKTHLETMHALYGKYEKDFKKAKKDLSLLVALRSASGTKKKNSSGIFHKTTLRDEVRDRMAVHADVKILVDEVLLLQAQFSEMKIFVNKIIRKTDADVIEDVTSEVVRLREKHWEGAGNFNQHVPLLRETILIAINDYIESQGDPVNVNHQIFNRLATLDSKLGIIEIIGEINKAFDELYDKEFIRLLKTKLNEKFRVMPLAFADDKLEFSTQKALEAVDNESIVRLLENEKSYANHLFKINVAIASKAPLLRLKEIVANCKKMAASEEKQVKTIRQHRSNLESRVRSLEHISIVHRENSKIKDYLGTIHHKMQLLYGVDITKASASKIEADINELIHSVNDEKRRLAFADQSTHAESKHPADPNKIPPKNPLYFTLRLNLFQKILNIISADDACRNEFQGKIDLENIGQQIKHLRTENNIDNLQKKLAYIGVIAGDKIFDVGVAANGIFASSLSQYNLEMPEASKRIISLLGKLNNAVIANEATLHQFQDMLDRLPKSSVKEDKSTPSPK
jgi:hypothetical protein